MHILYCRVLVALMIVVSAVMASPGFVAEVVSPANGSIVARAVGSVDPVVIECNIRSEDGQMATTTWTLQHYRDRPVPRFIIQSEFLGIFNISGDAIPSESRTYRNRLTILNFTEELDGTVLRCKYPENSLSEGIFFFRTYRPPQLLELREVVDVVEHANVTVNLEAEPGAFPYPQSFHWSRDGVTISNSTTAVLGYPTASFTNVSRSDNGRYELTATNYQLHAPSVPIDTAVGGFHLNVKFGPDLVAGPGVVHSSEGQDVVLVCGTSVRSNPPANVTWNNNFGNSVNVGGVRVSQTDPLSLNISKVTRADAGIWTCIVTVMGVGVTSHSVELIVVDPPPSPKDVTVTRTEATWIQVSWSSVPSGVPPPATVLYNVTATASGIVATVQVNSSNSATVPGLLPNTLYAVTVTALVRVGKLEVPGPPSTSVTVITKITTPELQCSEVLSADGMVEVRWRYVHNGGVPLTDVLVSYTTGSSQDSQLVTSQQVQLDADGRATSVHVHNLTAGITYNFRVEAINEVGRGISLCPPITPSTGVPQTPVILNGSSSSGEVVLEVSTKASGTPPSGTLRFMVRARHLFGSEEISFSQESKGYVDGEVARLTLSDFPHVTGVEPTYEFYVSCQNSFGRSNESAALNKTVLFTTLSDLEGLVGGSIVGGAAVVVIVVILVVILCCLCRRRRYYKSHRTEDRSEVDSTPAVDLQREAVVDLEREAALDLQREEVEQLEDSGTSISSTAHVHQLNIGSAPPSRPQSYNRTESGGSYTMRHANFLHQRSTSSLSSATPSDVTQGSSVCAGMDPTNRGQNFRYASPCRTAVARQQPKIMAVNPLSNHRTRREINPLSHRTMVSNNAPPSDLQFTNRTYQTNSLCQDYQHQDRMTDLDSPLSDGRVAYHSRQNSDLYNYNPTSSLV